MTRIHKRLYFDPWTTLVFFMKMFFPKSPRNQSSSYINSSQAPFNSYQLRFVLRHAPSATINKFVLVATTLSAYTALASDGRNNWSLIPVPTLSSSCFDCPECKPWTDGTSSIIHLKSSRFAYSSITVKQYRVNKCGERKFDCLVSFSIVSRQKKGGPKASGKMGDTAAGKRDRQVFKDLIA